jgi:glutamine amidotransferase
MIGVIEYGMGNLRSVQKAFELLGCQAAILYQPADLTDRITHLVLPGVGAFADGMAHLTQRGWIAPMRAFIDSGRPFLGICLGMQLLFDGSEEDAAPGQLVPGLGILSGRVERFTVDAPEGPRLKVPHMGWNGLRWERPDPLLAGLEQDAAVYFVHSYHAVPGPDAADGLVGCQADYGGWFCASVWRDRLWATQFHPEKSQRVGLRMLQNFAAAD